MNSSNTDSCLNGCVLASCGDGFVQEGVEACDSTPGCSSSCTLLPTGPSDTCPGTPIALSAGTTTFTGSTASANNNYNGCNGGSSKDVVYPFTPTVSGYLDLSLTTGWGGSIYAQSTCGSNNSQIACANGFFGGTQSIGFPVTAGTTYYVVVDGAGVTNQSGDYTLKAKLAEFTANCTITDIDPGSAVNNNNPNVAQVAPATCTAVQVVDGAIYNDNDKDDWFRFTANAGGTIKITAAYVVNGAVTCTQPNNQNLVIALYNGSQNSTPNVTTCAFNDGSLACQAGNFDCPTLSYNVTTTGEYLVHTFDYLKNSDDPSYVLYITTQ